MEYVEGDNLKNLIRKQGVIPVDRAVEIAVQISEALQHAHENSIIHRDLKPQNILITKDARAKLTDFGIAREAPAATLAQTDTIVGSVHYISPEQARGNTTDSRSDIYSLGIVLYEMVTGVLPFTGETPIGVALKHIQEFPALPASLNPSVSPEFERVIVRAMSKNPADRYQSAKDMAADLVRLSGAGGGESNQEADEFATRVIPTVRPSQKAQPDVENKKNNRKKRPLIFWLGLILLISVIAATGTYWYLNVPEVSMPDVEGRTEAEASEILQGRGIKNIQFNRNPHPSVTQGLVVSQDPTPDAKIKVTRTVTLSVSLGPELREVPEVIGQTLYNARLKISVNELSVNDPVQERYSDDHPEGVVVEQDPRPGTQLSKGSGVLLIVSKGPQPISRQVPSLVGLTEESARGELDKLNLYLDSNTGRATSTDYFAGQIISQDPAAGTGVREGTTVQVILSNGPGPSKQVARVEARIPGDDKKHELRIVVKDAKGASVFHEDTYSSGKRVVKEVPYYGSAVIQVYIDEELAGEQSFE
ncbi:MAG: PASTA domain-containing protein, partial [Desulfotomaculaceae bacterium]|nr:PASTA domain-containing protein [Desulfotomaculaceae bacterium]